MSLMMHPIYRFKESHYSLIDLSGSSDSSLSDECTVPTVTCIPVHKYAKWIITKMLKYDWSRTFIVCNYDPIYHAPGKSRIGLLQKDRHQNSF